MSERLNDQIPIRLVLVEVMKQSCDYWFVVSLGLTVGFLVIRCCFQLFDIFNVAKSFEEFGHKLRSVIR